MDTMKKTLRIGMIGLGARGKDLLPNAVLEMPQAEVTAVCDVYEDRAQAAQKSYWKNGETSQSSIWTIGNC